MREEREFITKVLFNKTKNKVLVFHIGITDSMNIQVNGKVVLSMEMEFGKI